MINGCLDHLPKLRTVQTTYESCAYVQNQLIVGRDNFDTYTYLRRYYRI